MDLSILASGLNDIKPEEKKCINKACAYVKKSRSHNCDDCAMLIIKEKYALLGVFDGLSGEAHAGLASSTALKAVSDYLDKNFKIKKPEEILEYALEDANIKINLGGTTASVVMVLEDGKYHYANVGDSHVYCYGNGSVRRLTKDDRDTSSLGSYLANRALVSQCLGSIIRFIDKGEGRLNKGDCIFAISDGILDNLFIRLEGGIVIDTSGKDDLEEIFKNTKTKSPKEFIDALSDEIKKRMALKEEITREGKVLLPKEDDASIALIQY